MRQNLTSTLNDMYSTRAGLWRGCALLSFVLCGCVAAAAQTTENVELLSVNAVATQAGNGPSRSPESSSDGRFVVYESEASDLVANDSNGQASDIFVRDLLQHTTTLVSVNAAGTASGNGASSAASITPDGRFVVFTSEASDLVAGDANEASDVFVRDLVAQTTTLVSVKAAGAGSGGSPSSDGLITPGGRYVVFTSSAGDLVAGDMNQRPDAFRHDLLTGTTVLVSVNTAGTNGGNADSSATAVSADGRYVLFASAATDLTADDTNGSLQDIFRRDLQTNTTALASVNSAGTGSGNASASGAVMSDDGQVVAFSSSATDLVPPGGANTGFTSPSIYAHDFAADTTTLISERQVFQGATPTVAAPSRPYISPDGRYIFYGRLFSIHRPRRDIVFRLDRLTGHVLSLPFTPLASGLCDSFFNCSASIGDIAMSRDGRYVAHEQFESDGITGANISGGIVIRDMVGGGTETVLSYAGLHFTSTNIELPSGNIADGGRLAFTSGAGHSAQDANGKADVYFFSPPARPRLAFTRANYLVTEPGAPTSDYIQVRRTGYLIDSTSTVEYATSDGTATAGSDYVAQSGTLTFAPGESVKGFTLPIIDDKLVEPDKTVNLTLSDPTGDYTLGTQSRATLVIQNDERYGFQFTAPSYGASEAEGGVTFTVTLVGNPSSAVSVDYATSDGTASERSDYITAAGRLTFAPGETSKTARVLVVDDNCVEGDETITLSLSNPSGNGAGLGSPISAELKIVDDDTSPPTTNPIDSSQFFVRQHYLDFLGREPDPQGLAFWTDQMTNCGSPNLEVCRVNVSAAFFLSIEFQRTGFLLHRIYTTAYGHGAAGLQRPTHMITVRVPIVSFSEFISDTERLRRDVIVGTSAWEQQLVANRQAFALEFVLRRRFSVAYPPGMTAADFVQTLNAKTGNVLTAAEMAQLAAVFGGPTASSDDASKRAQVLLAIADDPTLSELEFTSAFVLMQYFGYLRRNPDAAPDNSYNGYQFWLEKLVVARGDYIAAEMVKAFLNSDEYRKRFGQ